MSAFGLENLAAWAVALAACALWVVFWGRAALSLACFVPLIGGGVAAISLVSQSGTWRQGLPDWANTLLWLGVAVAVLVGYVYFFKWLVPLVVRYVGMVQNQAARHAPWLIHPWWILFVFFPWAWSEMSSFDEFLFVKANSVLWLGGCFLGIFFISFLFDKGRLKLEIPLANHVSQAHKKIFFAWIPFFRKTAGWNRKLTDFVLMSVVFFALIFMPPITLVPLLDVLDSRRPAHGIFTSETILPLGAILVLIVGFFFPFRLLGLAIRGVAMWSVLFFLFHFFAHYFSRWFFSTREIGITSALVPILCFLVLREISLIQIFLQDFVYEYECRKKTHIMVGARIVALAGFASMLLLPWGEFFPIQNYAKTDDAVFVAGIAFGICMLLGMWLIAPEPADFQSVGFPLARFAAKPCEGLAKKASQRAGSFWAEMERNWKRKLLEKKRLAEIKEKEREFKKLISTGRLRERCSEPLMLTCSACGGENKAAKWADKKCPDCGANSPPKNEAKCLSCDEICDESPESNRPCHSIEIYQDTGKVTEFRGK